MCTSFYSHALCILAPPSEVGWLIRRQAKHGVLPGTFAPGVARSCAELPPVCCRVIVCVGGFRELWLGCLCFEFCCWFNAEACGSVETWSSRLGRPGLVHSSQGMILKETGGFRVRVNLKDLLFHGISKKDFMISNHKDLGLLGCR